MVSKEFVHAFNMQTNVIFFINAVAVGVEVSEVKSALFMSTVSLELVKVDLSVSISVVFVK